MQYIHIFILFSLIVTERCNHPDLFQNQQHALAIENKYPLTYALTLNAQLPPYYVNCVFEINSTGHITLTMKKAYCLFSKEYLNYVSK